MTGIATVTETLFVPVELPKVPDRHLLAVPLTTQGMCSPHVEACDGTVVFRTVGWYEVLMTVEWDSTVRRGTRFSHTMVSDHEPLHSEAIDGEVLADLNGGSQLLRGNAVFGWECTRALKLGVWQDSGEPLELRRAQILVRELCVPWTPTAAPPGVAPRPSSSS